MKTSRRTFLATTGGMLGGLAGAQTEKVAAAVLAQNPFIVDCQSHLFCPELVVWMERRSADPRVFTKDGVRWLQMGDWMRKIPPFYLDTKAKLTAMDAAGISLTALSINDPGPEWFGADGAAVARMANDFIADQVSRHPTRFFGLCVLPWQNVKAAAGELDRCANLPGMKGLLLYTNLAGHFPDEPEYRPMLVRAAELGWPVLLHPAKPLTIDFVKGYEMTSSLGTMFDNTIALTRLIMSGVFDELPKLQLVCPHLGGTLPYIIGRLDHQTQVLKRGPKHLKRAPSEYLKQVWLDIVSPLPLAMKFAHEFMGPDRLLFASDHPWVEPDVILGALRSLKLSPGDEAKILGANAKQIFHI